ERAGVLVVRGYPDRDPELLVGIEWMPVSDEYVLPSAHGLAFDGRFNLRVAERSAELRAGAILVHAHVGVQPPVPSITDAEHGAAFMAFMHRRQPDRTSGLLVVADRMVTGIVSTSGGTREISRVVSAGIPTEEWNSTPAAARHAERADRQPLAVGADRQRRPANATIAVIGHSGG